jgi:hypothetical protein
MRVRAKVNTVSLGSGGAFSVLMMPNFSGISRYRGPLNQSSTQPLQSQYLVELQGAPSTSMPVEVNASQTAPAFDGLSAKRSDEVIQ